MHHATGFIGTGTGPKLIQWTGSSGCAEVADAGEVDPGAAAFALFAGSRRLRSRSLMYSSYSGVPRRGGTSAG